LSRTGPGVHAAPMNAGVTGVAHTAVRVLRAGWRQVRRPLRVAHVVFHIGTGFVLAFAVGAFFSPHRPVVRRASQWWLARLTRVLALDIEVRGTAPLQPALFVANHVSWIDIPVLGGAAGVHFLSKAEVARWPLIGALATAAGTLYITRGGGQVRERTRQIARHVAAGRSILVFPEGTTTSGVDVRAFHSPLFAAASDGGHAVQPVAIRYRNGAGEAHTLAPFIGDDEFHTHLWRLLVEDRIRVQVDFLPLIVAPDSDHRALAAAAHAAVRAAVVSAPVAGAAVG
jgi:1-acyl-sn-glycerol-3-phosphate acyltransferase